MRKGREGRQHRGHEVGIQSCQGKGASDDHGECPTRGGWSICPPTLFCHWPGAAGASPPSISISWESPRAEPEPGKWRWLPAGTARATASAKTADSGAFSHTENKESLL